MELSALTLRVLLLFFPGVLCAMIVETLTPRREHTPATFLTESFVFGISTYLLLSGTGAVLSWIAIGFGSGPLPSVTFFQALVDPSQQILWGEIAASAGAGVVLAGLVAALQNYKVLHRTARRFHISSKFGELDVWSHFLASPDIGWILVRDLDADRTYEGWLEAYSDSGDDAQLLLRDVRIYESAAGAELYRTKRVYLGRDKHVLVIETRE